MNRRLKDEDRWSVDRLKQRQMDELRRLLSFVSKEVPFYGRRFAEHGLNVSQIQSPDDFKRIPFTVRDDVQKHPESFVPKNLSRSKLLRTNTGGSTGIPLQLYYRKSVSRSREHAFIHNLWSRVGYQHGDSLAVLRGASVPQSKDLWYHDTTKNRLVMSSYHLNPELIPRYIDELRRFRPKYLHVYPASLVIVAKFMEENHISAIDGVKGVLAGSEAILNHHRELLERVFGCRLFSWYGLGEMVGLGGECEASNEYHFYPQYSYVELVEDGGVPGIGEIVGTALINPAMPLVRYRTMDMAEASENDMCACGRSHFRVKKVIGRQQELVVTRSGSVLTLTALIFGLHHDAFERIRRMQILQEHAGRITLRIDRMSKYSDRDEQELRRNIFEAVGDDLTLEFEYTDQLILSSMGKHKFLIQKLDLGKYT